MDKTRSRFAARFAVLLAVVAGASVVAASPASAGPPPWLAAGDQNGALGNCDPVVMATTGDNGSSWTGVPAFTPTVTPCTNGGRINAVARSKESNIWFAAGYQWNPSGRKQGVLLYSSNGSTWAIARTIPLMNIDTEFVDVSADFGVLNVGASPSRYSAQHAVVGPYTTDWQDLGPSVADPWKITSLEQPYGMGRPVPGFGGQQSFFSYNKVGATGNDCAGIGVTVGTPWAQNFTGSVTNWDGPVCMPSKDVRVNGIGTASEVVAGNKAVPRGLVAVGYTQDDDGFQQPFVKLGHAPWTHQSLSGEGVLNAIAFDQPITLGSGSVWIAVGRKKVQGVNTASIFRSTNMGASWTPITVPVGSKPLNDVAYSSVGFVAVGDLGTVLTSTDGFVWTTGPSAATAQTKLRTVAADR